MLKKIINPILFLHLALFITSQKATFSSTNNNIEWSHIDEVLEEKEDQIYIDYKEIETIILQNEELQSLKELVKSSSFNLSSKISQKYPSLDLQASGFP